MDNYIVRICRCEKGKPHCFVGVVEEVGVEEKKAFTNYDELWRILNPKKTVGRRITPDNGGGDEF